jgi:acyl-CoA dehydrogenase
VTNPTGSTVGTELRADLVGKAARIGAEVAGPAAGSVDREARFPSESFAALRREHMLAAFVPEELGGSGCSISDLSAICTTLGQSCASTAMVYAMHQIQVACMVRHGKSPFFRQYLTDLAGHEWLMASATTEIGVGGDVRTSICAVERAGGRFKLEKQAPVISYGLHSDAILVTARRAPDAAGSDQVIVLAPRANGTTLEQTSGWDTLGMRGTCSLGFTLRTEGAEDQILPQPYAEISAQTMLPFSHIVWTSLWLGIATDAVNRARTFIRAEARKKPGTTPPGSLRLAEVVTLLQTMRATVHDAVREYERIMDDTDALSSIGFAIRMNNLKVAASHLVVDVVARAMSICGIMGYKEDSKYSICRHLRDAYGASLMIANDRIYAANAALLLVHKDE